MPLYTNQLDFIQWIKQFNGAGMVTLATVTPVIMNRYDVRTRQIRNPFIGAVKAQLVTVLLNAQYENRVNQQRRIEIKPDDFTAEGLRWGICRDNIIVTHDGKTYVKTIELEKPYTPMYFHDGQQITYNDLRPFIPTRVESPKQRLDSPVRVRTFHINNIWGCSVGQDHVYQRAN